MEGSAYRDRSAVLVVFGILNILLGLGAALLALGTVAVPETGTQSLLTFTLFATYGITAGVGSILARRWARALTLSVSWILLLIGILLAVLVPLLMPYMLVFVPPSQERAYIARSVAHICVHIAVPLMFIVVYRTADVRATFEARDPKVRWTDRVPVAVLAISTFLAYSAVESLASSGRPAVPVMGAMLTGPSAALTLIALSGLLGWLAIQVYRLKESAWWTLVLLQVIGGVFGVMNMVRMPPLTAALQKVFANPLLWIVLGAAWCAGLAFLLRVRRYFAAPLT